MTENEIDLHTLDLLQSQGYEYINGTEIAPDGASAERHQRGISYDLAINPREGEGL